MTNEKAAMYRTAMVEHDTEIFKAGEFVSVVFIPTRGRGTKKFRCYSDDVRKFEVLYDYDLTRFTL